MNRNQALLAVHIGAFLFGLTGIFGKLTHASPWIITGGRALFAVLALLLIAALMKKRSTSRPAPRQIILLAAGGLLLAGHWVTFFHAVHISGVAIATLGFASFPAFTLLLEGLLFRERLSLREFITVGLVCLGLILVTPAFEWANQMTQGLGWAVLSGLLFALLSLLNRASTRGVDSVQAALWQNLTILLCLLPFIAPALPTLRSGDWLWIALLGILCTGLAHSLFVASLKVLNARSIAVVFALEPVYGIAIAWLIFDEQPGFRTFLGGALIILAIVLSSRRG